MPKEEFDFKIESVGSSESPQRESNGYKDTKTYKKFGWCKKRAVNRRQKISEMYAERLDKILKAYEMSKFLIASCEADISNDQNVRTANENSIRDLQSSLLVRTRSVLQVGQKMIDENSFDYPSFS